MPWVLTAVAVDVNALALELLGYGFSCGCPCWQEGLLHWGPVGFFVKRDMNHSCRLLLLSTSFCQFRAGAFVTCNYPEFHFNCLLEKVIRAIFICLHHYAGLFILKYIFHPKI